MKKANLFLAFAVNSIFVFSSCSKDKNVNDAQPAAAVKSVVLIASGDSAGIVFAMVATIVADVFPFEQRGRVMSYVQLAFAACQVVGLPAGIFLSAKYGWHMPFVMITVLCGIAGGLVWKGLKPIRQVQQTKVHPLRHLYVTAKEKTYLLPYVTTFLIYKKAVNIHTKVREANASRKNKFQSFNTVLYMHTMIGQVDFL